LDGVVIVIASAAVVILLTGLGVLAWWLRRDPHRGVPAHGPPFVLFPAHVEDSEIHPPALGAAAHVGVVERPPPVEIDSGELMALEPVPFAAGGARPSGGTARVAKRPRRTPRSALATEVESAAPTSPTPDVMNGTLRMLPGRLEVISGLPTRAEIRFVRLGTGDQEVTLGRQPGPPYEHVQLASQTVSRRHAVMRFARGGWHIANLSETNPLRVNGDEMMLGEDAVALHDGDLIELGEVQLRFRV
jgi:hypothetical protein